jgi:glycosyltransferase involved in cell wall biosynthesis
MRWHVLSSTKFDFAQFARASAADESPRHLLPQMAERLGAEVDQPDPEARPSLLARLGAMLYGQPEHWDLARRVNRKLQPGDAVYAAGCDSGFPVVVLALLSRTPASIGIAVTDVTRPRTRWLLRILSRLHPRLLIAVTTTHQAEAAEPLVGRRSAIHVIHGQTDCQFFRPLPSRTENDPPLVASCGAEQRDYVTLNTAMAHVEAQARVCFASPNLTAKTQFTMPSVPADNVVFEPMPFVELRNLYQRADVVVLPLLDNRYSAGLTALFEAVACGTPVVVTSTPGVIRELVTKDLLLGVPSGDPQALADAIQEVLDHPARSRHRAGEARRVVVDQYSADAFLERIIEVLARFEAGDLVVEEV